MNRVLCSTWCGFALLASLFTAIQVSGQPDTTKHVSLEYLKQDTALNYPALRSLYANDVEFFDPTGDVFDGDVSRGVIVGLEEVIALQAEWGLGNVRFTPDRSFYVGEWAVHQGTYEALFSGSEQWISIPFITVHHVVEGKIQSRTDFGEYIKSFGLGTAFDSTTEITQQVAVDYLNAYLGRDFETQAALMAENIVFQDPTAQALGPNSGKRWSSKTALLQQRKSVFANISDFGFNIQKQYFANHHALFIGDVLYTTASGLSFKQPAIFIVEVRNGQVTRHWDFVDYTVGPLKS